MTGTRAYAFKSSSISFSLFTYLKKISHFPSSLLFFIPSHSSLSLSLPLLPSFFLSFSPAPSLRLSLLLSVFLLPPNSHFSLISIPSILIIQMPTYFSFTYPWAKPLSISTSLLNTSGSQRFLGDRQVK